MDSLTKQWLHVKQDLQNKIDVLGSYNKAQNVSFPWINAYSFFTTTILMTLLIVLAVSSIFSAPLFSREVIMMLLV